MSHPDDLFSNHGASQVSLSEVAQAVMDVLEGCHGDLEVARRRLRGEELQVDVESSELPTPREQALQVAAELEACAGALRNTSAPTEGRK